MSVSLIGGDLAKALQRQKASEIRFQLGIVAIGAPDRIIDRLLNVEIGRAHV